MKIIVKEMKLLGFTHKAAASAIGVSEKTIGEWVAGRCKPFSTRIPKMKEIGFSDTAILNPTKDVEV